MAAGKLKEPPHRVWFVGASGNDLLNVVGPWAVLGHANDVLGIAAYDPRLVTLAGGAIQGPHGLGLAGARSLAQAARGRLPDTLVVAAGGSPRGGAIPQARLVAWLRAHQARIPRLVSICSGAFVLGAAGLLDGRRATTHWKLVADLQRRFPRARVAAEEIFVRDGKIWTSAGLTAGIDLALALVESDHGHATAMTVARNMVLFLRRSGHQAQFSETHQRPAGGSGPGGAGGRDDAHASEPSPPRDLPSFVRAHLGEALPVERLARHLAMSPRSVTRWCRQALGESPAALVRRLRIDEARRLLEGTALSLKEVADRAGIGDPSTLWRLFTAQMGVTPAEYRGRFFALAAPGRATA